MRGRGLRRHGNGCKTTASHLRVSQPSPTAFLLHVPDAAWASLSPSYTLAVPPVVAVQPPVFTVTALLALAMISVLCVPVSTAGALVIARSVPNNGSTFAFDSTLGFPGDNGEIRMIPEHALCMH